ncbi:hypothetical protein BDV10DRAFT_176498 [Aspergillus recurvatus]
MRWLLIDPAFTDPNKYHPCMPRTLKQMLRAAKSFPKPSAQAERSIGSGHNPADSFVQLPLEIRQEILLLLPIHDFSNLRLASRAMCTIFYDSHFWRSRFSQAGARWFISYNACSTNKP